MAAFTWLSSKSAPSARPNGAAVAAGLAATTLYASSAVPFFLGTMGDFGDAAAPATGLAVAFIGAGLATAYLSWTSRQPLTIGWSFPALLYMAAAAPSHSLPAITGASLVAAALLVALAFSGLSARIAQAIPTPVVMATLAGSALSLLWQPFEAVEGDPALVLLPITGYVLARAAGRTWFPPILGALLLGIPAVVFGGGFDGASLTVAPPAFQPAGVAFDASAIAALSLPLVAMGLAGNAEGFALVKNLGYEPPARRISIVTALVSATNALFAAPPATMARVGTALMAGPDAGPREARYWATMVASAGALTIAWFAVSAESLAAAVPAALIQTLVALAILPMVMEALRRALQAPSPIPAFVAFLAASSSLDAFGLGPATWGLVLGVAATWLAARGERLIAQASTSTEPSAVSQEPPAAGGNCPEPAYFMG